MPEQLYQLVVREYIVPPPFRPELAPRVVELFEPASIAEVVADLHTQRMASAGNGYPADYYIEPA